MARAALRRAPALLVTLLCALCAAAAGGKGTGVTTSARCQERGGNAGDDPDAALFCMASNVWMHADRAWAVLEVAPGGTTAAVQTAWRENNARKVTKSITMTALPVKNAAAHISNLLMPDQKLAEGARCACCEGHRALRDASSVMRATCRALPSRAACAPHLPLCALTRMAAHARHLTRPSLGSAEVAKAVQKGYFSGVTLAIELPYPAFPHNVAHWAEVFFPVYSALRSDEWKGYPIERVLLVGIRRGSWIDWYEQSLRLALAAVPGGADVPLVFWDELQPLGQDGAWVRFEYLLSTRDQRHPATGARGFASVADARAFRDDAYRASRLEPYVAAATPILYLGPDNNTRVENEIELLEMLEGYNRTVYKMDMGISMTFDLVVRTIAVVGVLVSITGASLTNAVLLPPGGVVYELLPYRWT